MAVCTTTLPAVGADACDFRLKFGRIDAIFWTRNEETDALTDVTDDAEWATRISNSAALTASGTPAPIRYMYVTGEWPEPEVTAIEVSNGRTAYTDPKHTLTLDADDVGATNSALLAAEQGTTKRRKVWFLIDDEIHGGNDGYEMDMTFIGKVIPASRQEKQVIRMRCSFEGTQTAPTANVTAI